MIKGNIVCNKAKVKALTFLLTVEYKKTARYWGKMDRK